MSFSTIMVHLDVGSTNDTLLKLTADLAGRFDASVIGISTCQPMQISYDSIYMSVELVDEDRAEIARGMRESEVKFRAAFQVSSRESHWRSSVCAMPAEYVASQSRAADLIITSPDEVGSMLDSSRRLDLGDLVMRAGRPLLVVPRGVTHLDLSSVMVAWSDTRESRRAVRDALPFLKTAGRVTVVQVAADEDLDAVRTRLEDVVGWLERNQITAEMRVLESDGDDAKRLDIAVQDLDASLLIAGAYGHSRLREWALGGITRNLLLHPAVCSFVSH